MGDFYFRAGSAVWRLDGLDGWNHSQDSQGPVGTFAPDLFVARPGDCRDHTFSGVEYCGGREMKKFKDQPAVASPTTE